MGIPIPEKDGLYIEVGLTLLHLLDLLSEVRCMYITTLFSFQDDVAFKQKQREQQKALKEAQAKASGKGPMGRWLHSI